MRRVVFVVVVVFSVVAAREEVVGFLRSEGFLGAVTVDKGESWVVLGLDVWRTSGFFLGMWSFLGAVSTFVGAGEISSSACGLGFSGNCSSSS